jgi:hypothetical protein
MSFGAKIVLTIVVCLVLSVVGAVGLGALLWSRHSGALLEAGRKETEQGLDFGRQTDEAGCLDQAIARYKGNRGFSGSIATGMFVQGCWSVSRRTAGFCDGVPHPLDVDIFRAARWQKDQARRVGVDEPFGGQIFGQQRAYCGAKASPPKALSPR